MRGRGTSTSSIRHSSWNEGPEVGALVGEGCPPAGDEGVDVGVGEVHGCRSVTNGATGAEPAPAVNGDLAQGRPSPLMMWRTFLDLEVQRPWHAVKVDDTEVGIEEGLAAGAWTVGVAMTGNLVGLAVEDLEALDIADLEARRNAAHARLLATGAHFVVDGIADLEPVIATLEGRLARGERP